MKELVRAFVVTRRGSKIIFQMLQPRIIQIMHTFTTRELCYIMHGYSEKDVLTKQFSKLVEVEVVKPLRNTDNVTIEELELMARVFCRSRTGTRNFHKLLE